MCIRQIYEWLTKGTSGDREEQGQIQEPSQELSTEQPLMMQAAYSSGLPSLRFGDSGNTVRVLQRLLTANGYPVRVDGSFGALTEVAVRSFQARRGLGADGVVGSRTWAALTR
ncbi:MAG: peptidoglycan-binding domain-containing protein [Scytonema sp. PMC 1069.18]|nr:peptidoglycan-binding domain-containing protein [Scytonema sp. PMC 1069.18]MEC4883780.1 peptidoglycan-binding domain-containing protein [Scytonema sp. PMC 1070.18]